MKLTFLCSRKSGILRCYHDYQLVFWLSENGKVEIWDDHCHVLVSVFYYRYNGAKCKIGSQQAVAELITSLVLL